MSRPSQSSMRMVVLLLYLCSAGIRAIRLGDDVSAPAQVPSLSDHAAIPLRHDERPQGHRAPTHVQDKNLLVEQQPQPAAMLEEHLEAHADDADEEEAEADEEESREGWSRHNSPYDDGRRRDHEHDGRRRHHGDHPYGHG
eukprot:TRINITY_DN111046_c0_g1_i1.p1 TRINITY_DN111046_c0_g1~~TRINITY_DN111046_c0_g1_i1.p1  ORF type:complete len:141 (-),score=19.92 TRINITY_DN111046_c0_g1_i1:55-477(-)